MSNSSIRIVSYTDKSFVVVGDTKTYKDSLKNLGGKWNGSLTNKETGEKFMGWIFYASKKNEIQSWIDTGCKTIGEPQAKPQAKPQARQEVRQEVRQETKQEMRQESKRDQPTLTTYDSTQKLEKTVQSLIERITFLEKEVQTLKQSQNKPQGRFQDRSKPKVEEEEVEEEVEEEEVQQPPKRLLKRY